MPQDILLSSSGRSSVPVAHQCVYTFRCMWLFLMLIVIVAPPSAEPSRASLQNISCACAYVLCRHREWDGEDLWNKLLLWHKLRCHPVRYDVMIWCHVRHVMSSNLLWMRRLKRGPLCCPFVGVVPCSHYRSKKNRLLLARTPGGKKKIKKNADSKLSIWSTE